MSSRLKPIGHFFTRHYILVLFIVLLPVMLARINPNPRSVIWSDSEGYYKYLPGLFIIKDFHQLPAGSIFPYYNEQGEYVNKYTCGIAYFELPFFWIAYILSEAVGADKLDYYNPVYCRAMAICGFCFTFLGLFILRRVLLRVVSSTTTFWVIITILFGTNLFHYTTREMTIAHGYSLFLFALFLYLLPSFFKKPTWKNCLAIGAILGWITLIRPTSLVVALLIVFYDVYSLTELKTRLRFLISNLKVLLLMIPAAIVMFIPQFLYWKEMTGHWFYYSYRTERFEFWNNPKLAEVLFDTQNGLFLYSPLVLLMIIGIFRGIIKRNFQGPVMLLIFCLITYFFASWWTWWFGGSFGHRCYVEFYALFAIPLAGLYQYILLKWTKPSKWLFFSLVIILCAFSVRLSYLYNHLGGPWDGEEWRWNWSMYKWVLSYLFHN